MFSHDTSDIVRADVDSIRSVSSQGHTEPIVDLTVLMDDDGRDSILINKDDDPVRLSTDFIRRHKLPSSAVKMIHDTIKDNIQYLNKRRSAPTPTREISLRQLDIADTKSTMHLELPHDLPTILDVSEIDIASPKGDTHFASLEDYGSPSEHISRSAWDHARRHSYDDASIGSHILSISSRGMIIPKSGSSTGSVRSKSPSSIRQQKSYERLYSDAEASRARIRRLKQKFEETLNVEPQLKAKRPVSPKLIRPPGANIGEQMYKYNEDWRKRIDARTATLKKELKEREPEPSFKPQLSAMTLAMTEHQTGNVFRKLYAESQMRKTRIALLGATNEEEVQFKPSIGQKSAKLATKRREGIYSECCSEADYLTTAEPPDLSGDMSTHSETEGPVDANVDVELGPQHNGHLPVENAELASQQPAESVASNADKKKEIKVPIHDYLYESRKAIEAARAKAVQKYAPPPSFRPDIGSSHDRAIEPTRDEFYARLHRQYEVKEKAIAEKREKLYIQQMGRDPTTEPKLPRTAVLKLIERLEAYGKNGNSAKENEKSNMSMTLTAYASLSHVSKRSNELITKARHSALREIFEVLMWSVVLAKEIQKRKSGESDNESPMPAYPERNQSESVLDSEVDALRSVTPPPPAADMPHSPVRDHLLDTSLAMASMIQPASIAEAVQTLLDLTAPALLSLEEFIDCFDVLQASAIFPPLNFHILPSRKPAEKSSKEKELECCQKKPVLVAKQTAEITRNTRDRNVVKSLEKYGAQYKQRREARMKERDAAAVVECTFAPSLVSKQRSEKIIKIAEKKYKKRIEELQKAADAVTMSMNNA